MANADDTNKLLMIIIAIFLPPVAVLVKRGLGLAVLLNLILTLLFWLPGFLHALYVVLKD
ncbi:MAG: YqaE/Pmp3 family membrane protein [Phycisphaerales bacterium]